jgi:hypothetical protein
MRRAVKMNKKLILPMICIAAGVGIAMALADILINGHATNEVAEDCLRFVAAYIGGFIGIFFTIRVEAKNKEDSHVRKIEVNDERNAAVRDKAGAMVNKFLIFLLPAVTLIFVLLDVEQAVLLIMCGLILLQALLTVCFHYYFNKRM